MGESAVWAAPLIALVVIAGGGLALRRWRRKRVSEDPKAAAQKAMRQLARERRKHKGTIRGSGQGGSDDTAHGAALGSDFGSSGI